MKAVRTAPDSPCSRSLAAQKRALDIFGAAAGLILLLPVFAAVAIAIKLDSRGPVFFRQIRVGRGGHPFRLFKFRSMHVGADKAGSALTVHEDKRVTRVGRFIRQHKIDELPQLINVLAGDMSLVGPRPEVPEFMAFYSPEQRAVLLSMKPGMTDYAAILFRNESALLQGHTDPMDVYRHVIMPIKYQHYQRYGRNMGVLSDLCIILGTILILGCGRMPGWLQSRLG